MRRLLRGEGNGASAGEHRREVIGVDKRLMGVVSAVVERPDGVAQRIPIVLALHHRRVG